LQKSRTISAYLRAATLAVLKIALAALRKAVRRTLIIIGGIRHNDFVMELCALHQAFIPSFETGNRPPNSINSDSYDSDAASMSQSALFASP